MTEQSRSAASSADATPHAVTIREAAVADAVEISCLLSRLGLQFPSATKDMQRYWEWLWVENPALVESRNKPPIGWVLEDAGVAVGFFGNISARYRFRNETLLAGVASSWGVEREYRMHASAMARRYFAQETADLLLATTASRAVGRIFGRYHTIPMPQPDYTQVMYWVLEAKAFLRAGLRKNGIHPAIQIPAVALGAPALAALILMQRRRIEDRSGRAGTAIVPLESVDDEFDDLWSRKSSDGRLYAYRQAADLRWHFRLHAERRNLTLICCRSAGRLAGYLALVREETSSIGLTRGKIVDLFVADDDPVVIDALVTAAADAARAQDCHLLEAIGFPASVRAHLKRYKPFIRRFADSPMHFRARSPLIQAALQAEDTWYPTLYDGDSSLY